jgi:hypothetical protein
LNAKMGRRKKPEVEVIEAIDERILSVGEAALTEPERYYRAIYILEGETSNGSFHQYLWNSPPEWPREALAALRAVGADQMASFLDAALDLLPNRTLPEDREERGKALDALGEAKLAELDKLSDRFSDYPEDLHGLVDAYVKAHDAQFLGPRTLLEMWRSKLARGEDTAPKFKTRGEIDFVKEAEEDRPYSSRPCPACDYPSPDYRISCKKCGYPHGRAQ